MFGKRNFVLLLVVGLLFVGCSQTKLVYTNKTETFDATGKKTGETVVTETTTETNKLIGSNAIELAKADAVKRSNQAKSKVIERAGDPSVMTEKNAADILKNLFGPYNQRRETAVVAPAGADVDVYLQGGTGGGGSQARFPY